MPDVADAIRELVAAYKCLVKVSHERLSAEQVGQLRMLEQHLAQGLMRLPRNRLERNTLRAFVDRMYGRCEGC